MYRYSGLIQCENCGKNFKAKKERGKIKYVCSGYDLYGKEFCYREVVKEEELDDLIGRHFSQEMNDDLISKVSIILINRKEWKIRYRNNKETVLSNKVYQV